MQRALTRRQTARNGNPQPRFPRLGHPTVLQQVVAGLFALAVLPVGVLVNALLGGSESSADTASVPRVSSTVSTPSPNPTFSSDPASSPPPTTSGDGGGPSLKPVVVRGRVTSPSAGARVRGASQSASGTTANLAPNSNLTLYCVVRTEGNDYFPYATLRADDNWSAAISIGPTATQPKARPFTIIVATATEDAVKAVQKKQTEDEDDYNKHGMGTSLPAGFEVLHQIGITRSS